jgi:hypothetical protein
MFDFIMYKKLVDFFLYHNSFLFPRHVVFHNHVPLKVTLYLFCWGLIYINCTNHIDESLC